MGGMAVSFVSFFYTNTCMYVYMYVCTYMYVCACVFCFMVSLFNSISTFVGYLMPNPS